MKIFSRKENFIPNNNLNEIRNKVNNELEKDKAYYNDIVIESKKSQNSKGRSR